MSNPYAQQKYLNKLKLQVRELLARAHDVLDDIDAGEGMRRVDNSITELAAAVAETEELLR